MAFNTKKFKRVMSAIGYLPANALSGLTNLLLGSTSIDEGEVVKKPGLLGLVLDGIKFVGRSIADFLSAHKKAIAVAAWTSLAIAGAVALTLFLWPAALTAVATFSIGGLSIAAIAGPTALAQIGVAAGLAAAAASAATYVSAAVGNFISWVADCCKNIKNPKSKIQTLDLVEVEKELEEKERALNAKKSPLNSLIDSRSTIDTKPTIKPSSFKDKKEPVEVIHHDSPLNTAQLVKRDNEENNEENIETISLLNLSASQ